MAQLAALRLDPADQLLRVGCSLLVLDPDVEILGVLAHDDEVDVVEARAHACVALARPDLRVHVELLAQRHVHGAEAASHRCRDRPFQRDARVPDRVEDVRRQRIAAVAVHDVGAGLANVPVEVDPGRFEDAACRLGQLGPRAVARNQNNSVRHGA